MTTNKLSFFIAIATFSSVSLTYFVNPKSIHSQELPLIIAQNAQNNTLNLLQNGQGLFNLQGRPNRNIKFASVTIKSNGKVQIALRLANGNMVSFEGKQIKKDAYSIIISLTNSGMASATGIINVEYGANNSINSMFGDGTLDGQQFVLNFNN